MGLFFNDIHQIAISVLQGLNLISRVGVSSPNKENLQKQATRQLEATQTLHISEMTVEDIYTQKETSDPKQLISLQYRLANILLDFYRPIYQSVSEASKDSPQVETGPLQLVLSPLIKILQLDKGKNCFKLLNRDISLATPDDLAKLTQAELLELNKMIASAFRFLRSSFIEKTLPAPPNIQVKKREEINEGTYAKVYRGQWGDREVALKTFKKLPSDMGDQEAQDLKNELNIMLLTQGHNSFVQLFGIVSLSLEFSIVMEYCDQTLDDLINKRQTSNSRSYQYHITQVTFGIAEGLEYLDEYNIVHRDLNPGNILLKSSSGSAADPREKLQAKIADLGYARFVLSENEKLEVFGTPRYVAPEVLRQHKGVTLQRHQAIDIFSFGVIIWELLHGPKKPFSNWENNEDVVRMMGSNYPTTDADIIKFLPIDINNKEPAFQKNWLPLMLGCLKGDPEQRPTAQEIKETVRDFPSFNPI